MSVLTHSTLMLVKREFLLQLLVDKNSRKALSCCTLGQKPQEKVKPWSWTWHHSWKSYGKLMLWENRETQDNISKDDPAPKCLNLGAGSSSPILSRISLVFSKPQIPIWFPWVMPRPTPGFNLFLRLLAQGATVIVPSWRFSQPVVVRGIHTLPTSRLNVLIQTSLYLLC